MRSKIINIIALLAFLASIAHAQKIVVDVDKTFDFANFKTFSFAEGQIAPKPSTSQSLVNAVEKELISRGLVRNDTAPDLRIAIMAAVGMDLQGVGPTWNNERYRSWGGYGNPAALITLTKGSLLIDVVETKNKFSIWHAAVKDVFVEPPTNDPEKDARKIESLVNKFVGKMFKKYPVKPRK